jgi:hypothetical protein
VVGTLAFPITRRLLRLVWLGPTPEANDVETAVLRLHLIVLRRQVVRPATSQQTDSCPTTASGAVGSVPGRPEHHVSGGTKLSQVGVAARTLILRRRFVPAGFAGEQRTMCGLLTSHVVRLVRRGGSWQAVKVWSLSRQTTAIGLERGNLRPAR